MSRLDRIIESILRRLMGEFPDPEQPKRLRRADRVERVVRAQLRGDAVRADYRRGDGRIAAYRNRGKP